MELKTCQKVIFCLILAIAFLFSGCTERNEEDTYSSQESFKSVREVTDSSGQDNALQSTFLPMPDVFGLSILSGVNGLDVGCASADGYYELDLFKSPTVLCFTDYATLQRIPLCGRPECRHVDESCPAVLPGAAGIVSMQEKLLIFCEAPDSALTILEMNRNGSERKNVVRLNSTDLYNRAFAGAQNDLFTIAQAYHADVNMQVPELIHIDLENGELQTLAALDRTKSWFLVGAFGENMLLKSIEKASNTKMGSPEAYASQVHTLYLYNVSEGKITDIASWKQDETLDVCYGDKLFLYDPANAVFSVEHLCSDGIEHLLTSQPLPLKNAKSALFYGFYEGQLVVEMGEELENPVGDSIYRWALFAVNADNGVVTELTLKQSYRGSDEFVKPVAEIKGSLLVKCGVREEQCTTEGPDGSMEQYNVIVPSYALIDSADYFASKPQYRTIS